MYSVLLTANALTIVIARKLASYKLVYNLRYKNTTRSSNMVTGYNVVIHNDHLQLLIDNDC